MARHTEADLLEIAYLAAQIYKNIPDDELLPNGKALVEKLRQHGFLTAPFPEGPTLFDESAGVVKY